MEELISIFPTRPYQLVLEAPDVLTGINNSMTNAANMIFNLGAGAWNGIAMSVNYSYAVMTGAEKNISGAEAIHRLEQYIKADYENMVSNPKDYFYEGFTNLENYEDVAAALIARKLAPKGPGKGPSKASVPKKAAVAGPQVSSKMDAAKGKANSPKKSELVVPKEKIKTKGRSEEQLSNIGKNDPVSLTKSELANVQSWRNTRNSYLKKWREMDVSEFSTDTQKLLRGSADNSIRKNMSPDDLAAVMKEKRGVPILKPDGTPYQHLSSEWPQARNSLRKSINKINEKISKLNKEGVISGKELNVLKDKLGDLHKILNEYKKMQIIR